MQWPRRPRTPDGARRAGSPLWRCSRSATAVWSLAVAAALVVLGTGVVRGHVGVDVIALLAMAGALAVGEELAGAVIALMLAGGNALEEAAGKRARRDLVALLERAPRIAHRREANA